MCKETVRWEDLETYIYMDREIANRKTERWIERNRYMWIERQTDRYIKRHMDIYMKS